MTHRMQRAIESHIGDLLKVLADMADADDHDVDCAVREKVVAFDAELDDYRRECSAATRR